MADDRADNVVQGRFGPNPYWELERLRDDLERVVFEHADRVPLALAIGVVEIVKHRLVSGEAAEDHFDDGTD